MNFSSAYLEKRGNRIAIEEQLLEEGLRKYGIPVEYYTYKRIQRRQLPLTQDTFLAGDMDAVKGALNQLDIEFPPSNDYPECLESHLHRRIWRSSLKQLKERFFEGIAPSVFVKPSGRSKRFTGCVLRSLGDFHFLGNTSGREPIICSELVSWVTEYRVYVANGEIHAVAHYDGDFEEKLDMSVVTAGVNTLSANNDAPAGYALDYGVLDTGETALVEFNDGFALGAYEIDSDSYTKVITTRWQQLFDTIRK